MKNLVICLVLLLVWSEQSEIRSKVKKESLRKNAQKMKGKNKLKVKDIFFTGENALRPKSMRNSELKKQLRWRKTGAVVNVVKKSQKYLDDQAEESQQGNAIYKSNKKGRDDRIPEPEMIIATGQVYTRIKQKNLVEDNMSAFGKVQFKLNQKMLYFLTEADDIRGVLYGLNLLDLVTNKDNILNFNCCARIEPYVKHVEIPLYQFKGYCFRIEMTSEEFLICDEERENLDKLRKMVIQQTMKHWWSINNPSNPFPLMVSETNCMNKPFTWTLSEQKKWPCICNAPESKQQSPIEIDDQTVEFLPSSENLYINFAGTYSLRYAKIVGEPEFHSSDLGSFTLTNPDGDKKYTITKFTFKVKDSEHKIINLRDKEEAITQEIVGEIQIYAETNDGKKAVMAVVLATGNEENEFIKNINPRGVSFEQDDDPNNIKLRCVKGPENDKTTLFNLRDLFKSNEKLKEEIYFYMYTGSYSKPPCTEGVTWFVMKHPAFISESQYDEMKQNYLTKAQIDPSNVRNAQPLYNRKVYYQMGVYACKEKPEPAVPMVPGEYKYIHAQQQYTSYAMGSKASEQNIDNVFKTYSQADNGKLIKLGHNVEIQRIDNDQGQGAQQIPRDTMENLIKKYTKAMGQKEEDRDAIGAIYE